ERRRQHRSQARQPLRQNEKLFKQNHIMKISNLKSQISNCLALLLLAAPAHAGTNAAVLFNTNTGALSLPAASAFYAANPPPGGGGGGGGAPVVLSLVTGPIAGVLETNIGGTNFITLQPRRPADQCRNGRDL